MPGKPKDDIKGELFEGWADASKGGIPYEALSYAWGSSEKTAKIFMDGSILPITSNLFSALRHIRLRDQDRILWIDAICINQEDNREKTHQVRHMGRIYKEAEKVLVWLGEGTAETDCVMDFISQWNRWRILVDGDWRDLVMMRVAIIYCGKKSVSARNFAQVPALMGLKPHPRCQAVLDIMPGHSRKESWWSKERSLLRLLTKFGRSEASDDRDIIYALLNISSDAYNSDLLFSDYSKSIDEVVEDAISFIQLSRVDFVGPPMNLEMLLQELDAIEFKSLGFFQYLLSEGDLGQIKLWITSNEVDINRKDKEERTPLFLAADMEHGAVVRLLIESGQFNRCEWEGPLHQAASYGRRDIVRP